MKYKVINTITGKPAKGIFAVNPDGLLLKCNGDRTYDRADIRLQVMPEMTTAEKLLWLVENRYLAYVNYEVLYVHNFGIGLNAWEEKAFFCPIIPTYQRYGKTAEEAINAAYDWAIAEKAREQSHDEN